MNYTDFFVKCVPPELVWPCQYQKLHSSMTMIQSYDSVPYFMESTPVWARRSPLPHCSTSLCSGWTVSRALLSHWPAPCLIQIGLEWPPRQAQLGHSYSKWTGFFLARWNQTNLVPKVGQAWPQARVAGVQACFCLFVEFARLLTAARGLGL